MTRKVYLDQCVHSSLVQGDSPWYEIGAGKLLKSAVDDGRAEIWTCPTQVLETFLCADYDDSGKIIDTPKLDLRIKLARNALEMIGAQRMAPSFEFIVVKDFMTALARIAPGSIKTEEYFDLEQKHNQELFTGVLGILAGYRMFDRPESLEELQRTKLTSRLLHSRFCRAPVSFLQDVIDCAKNFRVTSSDVFADVDAMSIQQINTEIEANINEGCALDKTQRTRLEKNKEMIALSYGAAELGQCLSIVFSDPWRLLLTFDIVQIKNQWSDIMRVSGPNAVPFPGPDDDDQCVGNLEVVSMALAILIKRFGQNMLLISRIPSLVAISEIEMCLRQGEVPTAGLTFDCDHAVMLARMNVFMSHDRRLVNLANRAKSVVNKADPHRDISVVATTKQLENILSKPVA
ncbi:hypothetical protein [Novipirellula sp.]|uniref:hypothetical protein n=1 Tax=Novipirellula sp. TaxID=2795430 RepID=UPI0035694DA8